MNQRKRTFSGNDNVFPVEEPKLFVGDHGLKRWENAKRLEKYIPGTCYALP
jgi:hypothetical protein